MSSKETTHNHERADDVRETIATYDRIAPHYGLTATPELRAWEERSMRAFRGLLPGKRVLVPGCGDGRDSRFLAFLGLRVISFDLSKGMLSIAKAKDPAGTYIMLDLRQIGALAGQFDGIWASGCLYHLSKPEFADCIGQFRRLLPAGGILYVNMKEGQGERIETIPSPGYPGGERAIELLRGKRYYAYYARSELLSYLEGFDIAEEDRIAVVRGGFELWLRRKESNG